MKFITFPRYQLSECGRFSVSKYGARERRQYIAWHVITMGAAPKMLGIFARAQEARERCALELSPNMATLA